jgi:hypothetical protein
MHFEDPGVSPSHGDFTHRIQWWLIYTCINPPSGKDWTDVFAALPSYMQVLDRKDPAFNQPENMNHYIMDNAAYPVLKAMLISRFNKRLLMSKSFNKDDAIWTTAYPEMKKTDKGFTEFKDNGVDIALALVPKPKATA